MFSIFKEAANAAGINMSAATPGIAPQKSSGFFDSGIGKLVGDGSSAVLGNAITQGFNSLNNKIGGGQKLPASIAVAPTTEDRIKSYGVPIGIAVAVLVGVLLLFKLAK